MNIISKQIAELTLDPRNMREHPTRNIESIAASLKRFGQQKPIVIDSANIVRCGSGTVLAAISLGWTHIECVLSDLDAGELMAFAVVDNRCAELAEWSIELPKFLRECERDLPDFDLSYFGLEECAKEPEVELRRMEAVKPPPSFTWYLIGFPTNNADLVQEEIQSLASREFVVIESAVSDHHEKTN